MKTKLLVSKLALGFLCVCALVLGALGLKTSTVKPIVASASTCSIPHSTAVPTTGTVSEGNYYLDSAKTATGNITVSGTVTLCLNGKKLDMGTYYITVGNGATLNICDCQGGGEIVSTSQTRPSSESSSLVTCIYNKGGTVSVTGGTIENSVYISSSPYSYGTGILTEGGTVSVSGGTIKGYYGLHTLNSATINVMENSTISAQSAGIYLGDGSHTLNVTGGTITASNTESNVTAGIRIQGTDADSTTLKISGGSISSPKNGIYHSAADSSANIYLSGAPTIAGTVQDISIVTATSLSAEIDSTPYTGEKVTIVQRIGTPMDGDTIVTDVSETNKDKFVWGTTATDGFVLTLGTGGDTLVLKNTSHNHDSINFNTAWSTLSGEVATGNYNLADNVPATGNITLASDATVNLCLNGKTLDMGAYKLTVPSGATLNIYDCAQAEPIGMITGTYAGDFNNDGLVLNNGTLAMHGGTIANTGTSSTYCWAVCNNAGTFTMDGGTLSSKYRYVLVNENRGITKISDGTVQGNSGIQNESGTVEISGTAKIIAKEKMGISSTSETESIVKITGGEISSAGTNNLPAVSGNGFLYIEGGTIKNTSAHAITLEDCTLYLYGAPTITSGTGKADIQISLGTSATFYAESADGTQAYSGSALKVNYNENNNTFTNLIDNVAIHNVTTDNKEKFSVFNSGYAFLAGTGENEDDLILHKHSYSYNAVDNVITESCTCGHSKKATLSAPTGTLTYNGTSFNASVVYDEGWIGDKPKITYTKDTLATTTTKNAGSYVASLTVDTDKTATVSYIVAQKDITNATIALGSTLTYNGTEQEQTISSVTIDGLTLEASDYTISGVTTATNVSATPYTLTITGKGNFTGSADKDWSIVKASYDMSGITFKNGVFTYDKNEHSIYIEGTLPEGVSVDYTNNGQVNVTTSPVIVTARFTGDSANYNAIPNKTATITVNKAYASIRVGSTSIVKAYGEVWTLPVATSNFGTVVCDKKASDFTGVGNYSVVYSVKGTDNYYGVKKTVYVTITKGSLALNAITFADKTVTYNGEAHSIELIGTLPTGVTVTYEGNGKVNAGVYTVTAKFEYDKNNYNEIAPMTATLTINQDKVIDYIGKETEKPSIEVTTEGGFAPNVEIVVTEIPVKNATTEGALKEGEIAGAVFDISMKTDGVTTQPDGTITIKLLIPANLAGKDFRIIHNHNGAFSEVDYDVDGNYAVFSVDKLSEFIFVYEKGSSVSNGVSEFPWLVIVIIAIVAITGVGLYFFLQAKKKKNNK